MIRPKVSEISEASMNQPRVFTPTRPMAAESSIWAIPTTRVENTRGAMIIRIRRRKMSVMMERLPAAALASSGEKWVLIRKPVRTPKIIALAIKAGRNRFKIATRAIAKTYDNIG